MKKLILLIAIATLTFSCKSETKTKEPLTTETNIEPEKEDPKSKLPIVDNLLKNSNLINLNPLAHYFEEDIVFEEINVLKTDKDTYTFIFVIDKNETDIEKLKSWKIGMYIYAKNPKEFLNTAHQEKGFATIGLLGDPKLMGDEVVVVLENFKIMPKEISKLKVYLYNNNGEMNKKYYNTNDIVLP